ncbi:hypothetical protein [Streptomyces sp. NRRL F-4474]|uniref:hypothetical protein n=1 Tax=Streptomyces sp. NRRL F-4474 TaxID=1463851 RepID=UPI00099D3A61|nr:hypothetical protein [Streptomyces sp. NRRL F-4474]
MSLFSIYDNQSLSTDAAEAFWHKQRNTVERCIDKLNPWRGLATRRAKTATIYLAGIFIWSAR